RSEQGGRRIRRSQRKATKKEEKRKAQIEALTAHPSETESTSRVTKTSTKTMSTLTNRRRNLSNMLEKSPNLTYFSTANISKAIGLDCEYVGAVSMVNVDGECIYDKYVKPKHHITSYRTEVNRRWPRTAK
uniref:Uncharacterized protein n=1 Tax=Parascaris equorum TaxID=6256 RepID=A0A914RVL8_PAREQ